MEMQKVPEVGYKIIGLPVSGIQRSLSPRNLSWPFRLLRSLSMAGKVVRDFKPHVAIGVGGYASGPLLYVAGRKGIPTLVQEQNSYAGLTNKWLAKTAKTICVAYDNMEAYFPAEKTVLTGNPVRTDILDTAGKRSQAMAHFGLDEGKKTILLIGGSLGARTLNDSIVNNLGQVVESGQHQDLVNHGGIYYDLVKNQLELGA